MSTSSDSLGEQLFELVELYNTGHSQKITGMDGVYLTRIAFHCVFKYSITVFYLLQEC